MEKEKSMLKWNAIALAVALAALAVLPALAEEREKETKSGADKLVGTYTVTKGQRDGKDIPKDHFEKSIVVFGKDRIYGHDKDKKEFFAATYTLDTTSKPWKISMTSTAPKKDKTAGVIEVMDDDTVRICYALPGGKTPTEFKAGENQHCFVLKRTKEKKTDK